MNFPMSQGNYARHAAIWNFGGPDRSEEINFYSNLAKKYGDRVLSLMCATGEIASGMAENGLDVTAVDIEPEMIASAKRKNPAGDNPDFLTGDIKNLKLPVKDYDFAFIGTGDFHHLLSEEEMLVALTGIHAHLRKDGGLALELHTPGNESWQSFPQRYDPPNQPESGIKTWKISESSYNAGTMRQHIRQEVFITDNVNTESFIHELDLQLITRKTLTGLLKQSGFTLIFEYGGYDFSAWNPSSDKWIIECVKTN